MTHFYEAICRIWTCFKTIIIPLAQTLDTAVLPETFKQANKPPTSGCFFPEFSGMLNCDTMLALDYFWLFIIQMKPLDFSVTELFPDSFLNDFF